MGDFRLNHIVLGHGEVGSAIAELIGTRLIIDPKFGLDVSGPLENAVLHVCIPYSEAFVAIVEATQERLNTAMTIVHSTVPLGTNDRLGSVSSPVRGQHPKLLESLRTFVKFFGGRGAEEAAEFFGRLGVSTYATQDSRSVEAMKLWETTQLGWFVILEKEIHRYCEQNGLDFATVYRMGNETYNDGYAAMGKPEYSRPVLKHMDGPVGGHCVLPNARLLHSFIAEMVSERGREETMQPQDRTQPTTGRRPGWQLSESGHCEGFHTFP